MQAGAGLVLECCEEAFAVLCRRIIQQKAWIDEVSCRPVQGWFWSVVKRHLQCFAGG